jgi:hypothetical protein
LPSAAAGLKASKSIAVVATQLIGVSEEIA